MHDVRCAQPLRSLLFRSFLPRGHLFALLQKDIKEDSWIVMLSFGGERTLMLLGPAGEEKSIVCKHGDAVFLSTKTNRQWKHEIRREPGASARASLVLRNIGTLLTKDAVDKRVAKAKADSTAPRAAAPDTDVRGSRGCGGGGVGDGGGGGSGSASGGAGCRVGGDSGGSGGGGSASGGGGGSASGGGGGSASGCGGSGGGGGGERGGGSGRASDHDSSGGDDSSGDDADDDDSRGSEARERNL